MSCRIQAVEHRKSAAGLTGWRTQQFEKSNCALSTQEIFRFLVI